jgi:hypothetical protein
MTPVGRKAGRRFLWRDFAETISLKRFSGVRALTVRGSFIQAGRE